MKLRNLFYYNENVDMGGSVDDFDGMTDEELDAKIAEDIAAAAGEDAPDDADATGDTDDGSGDDERDEGASADDASAETAEGEEDEDSEVNEDDILSQFITPEDEGEETLEAAVDKFLKDQKIDAQAGRDASGEKDEEPDFMRYTNDELLEMKETDPVKYDETMAQRTFYRMNKDNEVRAAQQEQKRKIDEATKANMTQMVSFAKKMGVNIHNRAEVNKFFEGDEFNGVVDIAERMIKPDEYGRMPEDALTMAFLYKNKNRILNGSYRKGAKDVLDKLENGIPEHQEPSSRSGKDVKKGGHVGRDIVKAALEMDDDNLSDADLDAAIQADIEAAERASQY